MSKRCRHPERMVEDGGPRNPWQGYTFCCDCGETIGAEWRRKIDDVCERNWNFRPNRTKRSAPSSGLSSVRNG